MEHARWTHLGSLSATRTNLIGSLAIQYILLARVFDLQGCRDIVVAGFRQLWLHTAHRHDDSRRFDSPSGHLNKSGDRKIPS